MTLEEAIKHAEYIVNNRKYAISVCWSVKVCEQIAEWLRELQERRKLPDIVHCGECRFNDGTAYCVFHFRDVKGNEYCSWAERRADSDGRD